MTILRNEAYEVMGAVLGSENPLPHFRSEENLAVAAEGLADDERQGLGCGIAPQVLPYRMQDNYTRETQPRAWRAWVLENDFLRAKVVPELGGRIVSLFHKPSNRELVERNPVMQLANRAVRNAWFSGGIEWNPAQFGHSCTTCSPVYAARMATPSAEPALRLYEWDRIKCITWQVDLHLPADSDFLFARVRLVNPQDCEVPMVWCTNIAVPETAETRVLCPADVLLWTQDGSRVARTPLPAASESDPSYPARMATARESYFKMASGQRPWIAALDGDGRGLAHVSTARQGGRYLFCWGNSAGGRRWQEALSQPGHPFFEMRAGLGATRLGALPMPAGAHWTWTEAFGMIEADPAKAHSANWGEAWRSVDAALDGKLSQARLNELDQEFSATTTRPAQSVLCTGSGWGALERKRLAMARKKDALPSELSFLKDYASPANDKTTLGPGQEPWLKLLETNILPDRNPILDPGQFMVQKEWQTLLEQSLAARRGDNWHSWYHVGNMRFEAFDYAGAREAWLRSLKHRRTAWVLRNMALLDARENRLDNACDFLFQALEIMPRMAVLAAEYAKALWQTGQYEKLWSFLDGAPETTRQDEEIRLLTARTALKLGKMIDMEALLKGEFAAIPAGDATLTELWYGLQECKLAAEEKSGVTEEITRRVRRECPVPDAFNYCIFSEEYHRAAFAEAADLRLAPAAAPQPAPAAASEPAPVPPSPPVPVPVAVPAAPAAVAPAALPAAMRQTAMLRKAQIELAYVMDAWGTLPENVRAAVVELIRNARKGL